MNSVKIAVIGLGYVGLPLARLFSTKYQTVGFDMNKARVDALMAGHDSTLEVSDELLQSAIKNGFKCTADIEDIRDCNFYVVAVPTPVDEHHNPDLTPLYGASTTVGKVISKGDVVVYESTVYPGVTEEECIPVVERVSGLKLNMDFFAGYSPERINPGDKLHTVEKIKKVTSGSTIEIGKKIDEVYAGDSALEHLTMMNAAEYKVYAVDKRNIDKYISNEIPEQSQNCCKVEIWNYDPRLFADENNNVDIISLYSSFMNFDDERVHIELEELMEEYLNDRIREV